MYYKIQDFLNDWDYESNASIKILKTLTDDSLNVKVYPEGRFLGYLGWHITISVGEMMNRTGLNVKTPDENSDYPKPAREIASVYEEVSKSLVSEIKNKWKDETLNIEDEMYGSKWKRGNTLGALIAHQIHHRGQMTVLMRQAGLKVPGIYGPSKEEWINMGMQPMK
jgi:uncharacterized damage-inducible protein DinB